ncbi:MAG: hypothetical protein IPK64_08090 [bacterium]|nr:hypothetical protein [bacterium]
MAIQWSVPSWLWPLLLVLAAGAVVFTTIMYRRTVPDPGPGLRRLLVVLRGAALGLLVVAAAGPVTSCLRPRLQPAELLLVVEDSASMALAADAAGSGAPGRWDVALAALAHVDSVFALVQPGVRRTWLRGNGLQPLQELGPGDGSMSPPARQGTSLTALSRRLHERVTGRPVRAVVLVSDGGETVRDAQDAALANAAAALPLRVLGVGPGDELVDRALVDVRHAETTYVGQDLAVEFAVAEPSPSVSNGDVVVTLSDPDGIVAADTLRGDGALLPGRLVFRPRSEGLLPLRLEVSPLANERFRGNNSASLVVDVRRDRLRVLVVAGTPGWDVRFLAVAAAAEPRLALTVAYPAADGLVLADSLKPWLPPRAAEEWAQWDAVVLTGWTGIVARLDWTSLGQAVEGGLGLLVLPSSSVGPTGGPVAVAPPAPLMALLPVAATPWRWEPGARFAAPTAEGARHPVLDGVAAGQAGMALAALPPWREVVRVVPGPSAATLLAGTTAGGGGNGIPALVVAPHGQGRVAWFGVRHVWEWAFWELPGGPGAGREQPARRTLRNLLVWLAGGDGSGGLGFATRPGAWQEGQPVRIAARWRNLRGEPVTDRLPHLELRPAGPGADTTAVRTFEMTAVPGVPGDSSVEVAALAPGRYGVRLVAKGEPSVTGAAAELLVSDISVETTQVRQDRSRLQQLAARAGGTYRDLGRSGSLAELEAELLGLDWRGVEDRQRRRLDLRSGWPLIAAVTLLLGSEWFLRRRHGLL